MSYTEYKDTYLDALKKGLVGEEYANTLPNVNSNNPYAKQMNEELEIGSFAHSLGSVLKDNMFGGEIPEGGEPPNATNHHHDDRYAKIVHDHDDRYYTEVEVDAWRRELIDGNLLFNKINANHIQAGSIVAGSTVIADGAIGSAQINRLEASKLDAGTIDTSKITIMGANGNLKLFGNRLQVFQGIGQEQYERVSLGDVENDGTIYGLRVRGTDGNTILYDENGVYREGITDGSITNDKIGGDANIDGGKLDIGSVIRKINEDGSETINGVKIHIDNESLIAKLNTINMKQDEHSETIQENSAKIDMNSSSIKLKVDEQIYKEDMSSMTSELQKHSSSIEVLKEGIALSATKTEVINQIKEVSDFVSSEIGDIHIGGANYLNNSAPRKAIVDNMVTWDKILNGNHRLVHWTDFNDTVQLPQIGYHAHIDLNTFHFPCIALINKNATWEMANRYLGVTQEIHKADERIIVGDEYTISFDAYADVNSFNFHGGLYHRNVESEAYGFNSGYMGIVVPSENVNKWCRYTYTFKTHLGIDLSQPVYIHIYGHNNPEGSGYFKNVKLETGNKSTQWTPSQFDVDESLEDAVDSMKDHVNESIKTYDASLDIKFDNINMSVSETIKDLDGAKSKIAEIDIKADGISQRVSGLDGKYTELKQTVDGIDITGKVDYWDLENKNSWTTIHGGNIKTDTISLKSLNSNDVDPIIKLFPSGNGYCSLDATKQYETGGRGDAVRLKWDRGNYVAVGDRFINFFMNGVICGSVGGDGLRSNGSRVSVEGHSHSGYASSYHSHSSESWGSLNLGNLYINYLNYKDNVGGHWAVLSNCHIASNGNYWLGTSSLPFYSANLRKAPTISSDIKFKENVKYVSCDGFDKLSDDNDITLVDMHNFIKKELPITEYNYICNEEIVQDDIDVNSPHYANMSSSNHKQIGFIAQDIINTKVGSGVVFENEDGNLTYELSNYISVIGGALKYEINNRDKEINELKQTINNMEQRLLKLEGVM